MIEQESSPLWLVLFIAGAFAIVFPLFWCGIIYLLSWVSGWQGLARRYHALRPTTGKRWSWQYGMVNWVGYNGVLILTANAEGLFMETIWLFRWGNQRLFIPWQEFHDAKIVHYFFFPRVRAKIGLPSVSTVHLPVAVFEESEGRVVLTKGN